MAAGKPIEFHASYREEHMVAYTEGHALREAVSRLHKTNEELIMSNAALSAAAEEITKLTHVPVHEMTDAEHEAM